MVSRPRFSGPAAGISCPLCMSGSYTIVARRDPKRGLMQNIYRCEACKSHFGHPGETDDKQEQSSE
jgi:hypothetical protein